MSEHLIPIIVAFISSGAFAAIINLLFAVWKEKKSKVSGVSAGVRIILYDRIKWMGKKYLDAGEISQEDLEDLIIMHQIYHDELKGNGFLDTIMFNVKKLPLKK